jgi:RNA polymerase sigma factor (sigma-70 family)
MSRQITNSSSGKSVQLTLNFGLTDISNNSTVQPKEENKKTVSTKQCVIVDEILDEHDTRTQAEIEAQAWQWTLDVEKWIWKQIRVRNIPEQDREDVFNLCSMEVFHVMKRYNPKYSKVSWANFGVLKAMKEYESLSGVVRLPFHVIEKMSNLRKVIARAENSGETVSFEEMQQVTKMKSGDLMVARERYAAITSTNSEGKVTDFSSHSMKVANTEANFTDYGCLTPEEQTVEDDQLNFFYKNLEFLDDVEIFVLVLRYGLDTNRIPKRKIFGFEEKYCVTQFGNGECLKTQDISEILGVSRERIRQIELSGIERIKKELE